MTTEFACLIASTVAIRVVVVMMTSEISFIDHDRNCTPLVVVVCPFDLARRHTGIEMNESSARAMNELNNRLFDIPLAHSPGFALR